MNSKQCSTLARTDNHPSATLLNIIGDKRAEVLQKALGGSRIWIPKDRTAWACQICRNRDEHIQRLRAGGVSTSSLCQRFSLSEKSIYRILNNGTNKSRQKFGKKR